MKKDNKSENAILRQKAEELMMKGSLKLNSQLSKVETALIHELEVHQIELEMQNDELFLAKERAEIAAQKITELYDFAPSGYFRLSKEGVIIELNLHGSNMLGKDRSHLKNSYFGFFVSDGTKPIFNLFLDEVFTGNTKESCELTLLPNDNPSMNVYLTGIVSENGDQCYVTMFDITEWKKADDAIKENDEKYHALVEHALEGIVILELDGTVEFVNQAVCRLFEFPDTNFIIGKKVYEFMFPESAQKAKEDFINVIKGIDSFISHYHCFTLSGKKIWVESIGKKIQFEGKPSDIISIRDITERKHVEIAINESELKYHALFDNSLMGITESDPSGRLVNANMAYLKMYGYESIEDMMKEISDVGDLYANPEVGKEVLRMLDQEGFIEPMEIEVVKRDGEHFFVLVSANEIKDAKGSLLRYQEAHIDITERKMAEEALKEKAEQLEQFNNLMADREIKKMANLKNEINRLLIRLGEPEKYVITNNDT